MDFPFYREMTVIPQQEILHNEGLPWLGVGRSRRPVQLKWEEIPYDIKKTIEEQISFERLKARHEADLANLNLRPHRIYGAKIRLTGQGYEAYHDDVCGFGKTPDEAMGDFDRKWMGAKG